MTTNSDTSPTVNTTKPARTMNRVFLASGLALLLATGAFFSGLQMGTAGSTTSFINTQEASLLSFLAPQAQPAEDIDLSEFWRVWNLMEDKFVVSSSSTVPTDEDRVYGAIKGLVERYDDPYTIYLEPRDASAFEEEISGNFGGVGMEVGIRDGYVTIIAPLPDTPAEQAGLLPGDIVARIDDESTEDMGIDEAVQKIRGEVGTEVVLSIFREGATEVKDVAVVRDTIAVPTIDTETRGDVFIISLYNFNALSEMKMQEALREYVQSGSDKLVLDVRGNPGGYLQSAISIASYFLPAGKVVVREGFGDGTEELYRSSGKTLGEFSPAEMVVLVNEGSASASEILAGALKEHNVATLIGQTTFGKGSVQELVPLPSGASLKVTIARWFTPDGTSISEGGLDPSIFVERTVEQMMAEEDPQLEAALAWLSGDTELTAYRATSTENLISE